MGCSVWRMCSHEYRIAILRDCQRQVDGGQGAQHSPLWIFVFVFFFLNQMLPEDFLDLWSNIFNAVIILHRHR